MTLLATSVNAHRASMDGATSAAADAVMYGVVGLGATSALILLIVALVRGRRKPQRLWQWIAALVLQGVPAAFLTLPAVMTIVQGMQAWITVGVIGLWLLIGLTFVRPRWAAWELLATAVAVPALVWAGGQIVPSFPGLPIDPVMVLGFYSARSVISAGLLWWAGQS